MSDEQPTPASMSISGGSASQEPSMRQLLEEWGYTPEAVAFLGIGQLKGVGFQTLRHLGGRSGVCSLLDTKNVPAVAAALSEAGSRVSIAPEADWDTFRKLLWSLGTELARRLIEKRTRFLFAEDDGFPSAFTSMPVDIRPAWIFIRGDVTLLERPSLAVVGTREPTEEGEFLARYAVAAARELDAPVVSGLAKGIDRIAHEWCLRLRLPTISVLGTGILTTYPARHAGLSDAIVGAGGALVTEYFPDQGPTADQFVWRNRLQAALARAVIPAEWKRKSGTTHTVRFARALKRPVYGLNLPGTNRNPDAGESDRDFTVATEHVALIGALRTALDKTHESAVPRQIDLFGGNL